MDRSEGERVSTSRYSGMEGTECFGAVGPARWCLRELMSHRSELMYMANRLLRRADFDRNWDDTRDFVFESIHSTVEDIGTIIDGIVGVDDDHEEGKVRVILDGRLFHVPPLWHDVCDGPSNPVTSRPVARVEQKPAMRAGKSALMVSSCVATAALIIAAFGPIVGWILVGIVVFHELGHAIAARRLGVRVKGAIGILIGAGVLMDSVPPGKRDWLISIAGPVTGLPLALLGAVAAVIYGDCWLATIGLLSAWLNVLNLLPIPPLDGGRMLRNVVVGLGGRGRWLPTAVLCSTPLVTQLAVWGLTPWLWIGAVSGVAMLPGMLSDDESRGIKEEPPLPDMFWPMIGHCALAAMLLIFGTTIAMLINWPL